MVQQSKRFRLSQVTDPSPALLRWMQDTAAQKFAIGNQGVVVPPRWELVQGLIPDMISQLIEDM